MEREAIKQIMINRQTAIREIEWIEPEMLFQAMHDNAGFVWLDSGMDSGRNSRWSYIMWEPFALISGMGEEYTFKTNDATEQFGGDPFKLVKSFLSDNKSANDTSLPPFNGGAAGFFGYDLLKHCEPSTKLTKTDKAVEGDLWLGFYDRVVAFDHISHKTILIVNMGARSNLQNELDRFKNAIENLRSNSGKHKAMSPGNLGPIQSNFLKHNYMKAVEQVRSYIKEGDCYQANIAQQFTAESDRDPADLYLNLRSINPAPFAAYIDTGAVQILSSSPEQFLQLENGKVRTCPIKGTRPRGGNDDEDTRLAYELIASDKDRAENVMIVDLMRNDLSRVCRSGSVKVAQLCALQTLPTVFHLVSTIEGELMPGKDAIDLLKTAFPGGSITGAPKIRAMEIIDELEPAPRGVYCGAIGCIGFDGSMDTSVVIRTIVRAGGTYSFHAGGGVTWLSDASEEYDETLDKAKALIEALEG